MDETQSSNYIDVYFQGTDKGLGASAYHNTTKRVSVTAFVSVDKEQTRTVKLGVWSIKADSMSGELLAVKIK